MKKILILCFLLFFAVTAGAADKPEVFNFRGIEFGMSMEEVQSIETGQLTEKTSDVLDYKIDDMYEMYTVVSYLFENASLDEIIIYLDYENFTKDVIAKNIFDAIKEDLEKQFGQSSYYQYDYYKEHNEEKGTAIINNADIHVLDLFNVCVSSSVWGASNDRDCFRDGFLNVDISFSRCDDCDD